MNLESDGPLAKFRSKITLPLSEAIRPTSLDEYIGQTHLINSTNGAITNFMRLGYLPSMILSGPPGVGKTTIASLISRECGYVFVELSATDGTVADLKALQNTIDSENSKRLKMDISNGRLVSGISRSESDVTKPYYDSDGHRLAKKRHTGPNSIKNSETKRHCEILKVVVFIDEIHRFSKTQQDFLLPYIEGGNFTFIGATTVDPQKRIRRAILSRCQVFKLQLLTEAEVSQVLGRAILFENIRRRILHGLKFIHYDDACVSLISKRANGDTRAGINLIELISTQYTEDKYIYTVGNMEPYSLKVQDLQESIKSLKHSQSGLQDLNNIVLFRKMFDSLNGENIKVDRDEYLADNPLILDSNSQTPIKHKLNRSKSKSNGEIPAPLELAAEESSSIDDKNNDRQHFDYLEIFKSEPLDPSDPNIQYLQQMQVSDDSDIEYGSMYSDDDLEPLDLSTVEPDTYFKILAVFYLNLLLKRGEAPFFIGKQLLLYIVSNINNTTLSLRTALGFLKSLKHANVDQERVLSNLIEWIIQQPKLEISELNDIAQQVKLMKSYFDSINSHMYIPEPSLDNLDVDFDLKSIAELLNAKLPDLLEKDQNPEFIVRLINDFEGDDINIGDKSLLE